MEWQFSIERHRGPLLVIIAGLYAMMELTEGGNIARLKRSIYRKVLWALRPAEAAVRRLIIAAAHVLKLKPGATGAAPAGPSASGKNKTKGTGQGTDKSKSQGQGRRPFRLFDLPRRISPLIGRRGKRRRGPEPRIRRLDWDSDPRSPWLLHLVIPPVPAAPAPDDSVSAASLCRRLAAILDALNDLPRQARRYARWRDKPIEQRRPKRDCALRTGPPPYLRRKSKHEVHYILDECHWLAREALKLDTS